MSVSKVFYKYYLLSRASHNEEAKARLRILYPKFHFEEMVNDKEMKKVEVEVFGYELDPKERHVNRATLSMSLLIESFLKDEYVPIPTEPKQREVYLVEERARLGEFSKEIRKIKDSIIATLSPEAKAKAIRDGIV